jgi:hypothetical protein
LTSSSDDGDFEKTDSRESPTDERTYQEAKRSDYGSMLDADEFTILTPLAVQDVDVPSPSFIPAPYTSILTKLLSKIPLNIFSR